MSALSVSSPFPIFTDIDGQPLDNGYIWLGTANQDPQANPITAYWDAALTITAPQPIRTLAGYPSWNGTPARLYASADYSIRVQNKNGSQVYSAPDGASDRFSSAQISFLQAGTNAVPTTVQAKLRETVSVLDFGADPTGVNDSRQAFQDAIEYAANLNGDIPVTKGSVSTVIVPAGKYKIASTLYIGWAAYSSTSAFRFCNLVGEGNAELNYTGAAECLIIGNNTSYGVLPVEIKNLKISRADKAAGTVALRALNAGYCVIENIGVDGFEFGLKIQGSIGSKIDGKMSFINSDKCIRIESYQPDAPVLRLAANNISVSNYHLGDTAAFGVQIQGGSGVSPSGAGGLIELKNITFESFTSSGIAIQISTNGEVSNTLNQIDTVLIDHCWFENAGALLVDLTNAVAKLQYCWFGPQSAGSPVGVARLNDNFSSVWIDHCYGYNYSTPVVVFDGSATPSIAKQRIYIGHYRKFNVGTDIIHTDWPINTLGVRPVTRKEFAIQYNSTYPAGNVDSNALLTLDIAAEALKMFGTGWTYVDVVFTAQANVTAANTGRVSLRVYNNNANAFYSMGVTEAGTSTAYTITGTSIQFGTGATTVVWSQMIGVWECNTANGQY